MTVTISDRFTVGAAQPLLLVAGPCQIESREHSFSIASFLADICKDFPVSFVFKSSFDKANRTSINGARGIGIEEGLKVPRNVAVAISFTVLHDGNPGIYPYAQDTINSLGSDKSLAEVPVENVFGAAKFKVDPDTNEVNIDVSENDVRVIPEKK